MKYSRLFRNALLLSVFVLMVGGFGSPVFAEKILLLSDTNSVGVNALLDDFITNGDEVTVVFSPDSYWTGANPSPEGFHSIVHLNGITWYSALSYPAQTALVEFANNGGAFIPFFLNQVECVRSRIQGFRGSPAFHLGASWMYEEIWVDDNMA